MAERVSFMLQIMRAELAAQRERRHADRAGTARIVVREKLFLKRSLTLALVPVSPPAPVELPSPLPPPAPHPEPVASRMSVGAWSGRSGWRADH